VRQYYDGGFILYFDRFWLEIFYHLVWDAIFVIKRDGSRGVLFRNDRYAWNEMTTESAELNKQACEEIAPHSNFIAGRRCVFDVYVSVFYRGDS
jgi:hypothetical protein